MNCYLCGSDRFVRRFGRCRDNPDIYPLECVNCGFVCLSGVEHIDESFYQDSRMHEHQVVSVMTKDKQAIQDMQKRINSLKEFVRNKKILDFGCGRAEWLEEIKDITQCAIGFEPEAALQLSYAQRGLVVVDAFDKIPHDKKFDVITLFHVLEHIPDPRDVINKLKTILAPQGTLIIEVPNANDALLKFYANQHFAEFTYWSCHLFLYTNATLKMLLNQCGLESITVSQLQRYPLSNHLFWLAKGKPGGHENWSIFNSSELSQNYASVLAEQGLCDTLWALASIS